MFRGDLDAVFPHDILTVFCDNNGACDTYENVFKP